MFDEQRILIVSFFRSTVNFIMLIKSSTVHLDGKKTLIGKKMCKISIQKQSVFKIKIDFDSRTQPFQQVSGRDEEGHSEGDRTICNGIYYWFTSMRMKRNLTLIVQSEPLEIMYLFLLVICDCSLRGVWYGWVGFCRIMRCLQWMCVPRTAVLQWVSNSPIISWDTDEWQNST